MDNSYMLVQVVKPSTLHVHVYQKLVTAANTIYYNTFHSFVKTLPTIETSG